MAGFGSLAEGAYAGAQGLQIDCHVPAGGEISPRRCGLESEYEQVSRMLNSLIQSSKKRISSGRSP